MGYDKKRYFAIPAAALILFFLYQNCGQGFQTTLSGSETDSPSQAISVQGPDCLFNSQKVLNGESVTAYQFPSVAPGKTCVSEVRFCTQGFLSGNYTYPVCSIGILPKVKKVSAGFQHGCALIDDRVKCWGKTLNGWYLFSNGQSSFGTPQEPKLVLEKDIQDLSVRSIYSECHIQNGALICTGDHDEEGLHHFTSRTLLASGAGKLSTSHWYVCSSTSVGLRCWGTYADLNTSQPNGFLAFSDVNLVDHAIGGNEICALTSKGTVKCLVHDRGSVLVAPRTLITTGAKQVELDQTGNGCALVGSNLSCWATSLPHPPDQGFGYRRPDGTLGTSLKPELIASNVLQFAMAQNGFTHSICVVKSDGSVQCWGNNSGGTAYPATTMLTSGALAIETLTGISGLKVILMKDGRVLTGTQAKDFVDVNLD